MLAQQADLQGPRGVRVADREREVRHAAEHHALVRRAVGQPHHLAVDDEIEAGERQQPQPGRGDDDVGRQLAPGGQAHTTRREPVDAVGDDIGAALADDPEEVAVGHGAQPLVPRVVRRVEVGVDVETVRQLGDGKPPDDAPGRLRVTPTEPPNPLLPSDIHAASEGVPAAWSEHADQRVGEGVASRHRQHVARGALQHRHLGALGERGHQRDRRRAAADDDDAPADVVEVVRPALRVHERSREVVLSLEARREALLVVVVAGRAEDPPGGQALPLAGAGALDLQGPPGVLAAPRHPDHAVPEPDVVAQPALPHCVMQIGQDGVAGGDRVTGPRLELVAEREQVGVRADAGVAEQVPCAADRVAGLEDREADLGQQLAQVVTGSDTGDAGADDGDVEVGCAHGCVPLREAQEASLPNGVGRVLTPKRAADLPRLRGRISHYLAGAAPPPS